ncbi:CDP-alcohol phosphatidyltransferase family protein [Leptospira venezuelensis]|uniref:CDP-alcohol phosphatidyltransferase family protein n=1 Tax=Leptospira venezuelensis TaxID=1958811 RepID=UPI000A3D3CD1|nr:CDP-alcohol phosphatidyltransferase family protein [Leptospira venezuelensis]
MTSYTKYIPNCITILRFLTLPFLAYLIYKNDRFSFSWLFFVALLSDIADGLIARIFRFQSEFGAKLDSWADLLLFFVGIAGILTFEPVFFYEYRIWISIVLILYFGEMIYSLWKFRTISSFHTYASRVAAYCIGILFMTLFWFGTFSPIVYISFFVSCFAYAEEILILRILDELRSNVRGLYWIQKEKRKI